MTEIARTIDDDTVEWLHHKTHDRGKKLDQPYDETVFESDCALALMLINGVVFLNSNWWEDEWPEEAKKMISVNVNCNDVFAWGSADAERLPYGQIETVYRMWRRDPSCGPAIWCITRRKEMPQGPVEKRIRAAGIWDLDSLGLRDNTTDAEVSTYIRAVAAQMRTEKIQS